MYTPDFTVAVPDRVAIVPEHVELASESRALKRREFDLTVAQRKQREDEEQAAQELRQKQSEDREIRRLRGKSIADGGLIFRAKPILTVDPFPARCVPPPPLTEPESPHLRTATRKRTVDIGDSFNVN